MADTIPTDAVAPVIRTPVVGVANVADLTDSQAGFFKGLIDSKKFGLCGTWVVACMICFEATYKTSATLAAAALGAGTLAVCAYTIAQAYLEARAVSK